MEQATEFYIEPAIHSLIDIVFARTFMRTAPDFKSFIRDGLIRIDIEKVDLKQYLPPFDCLYYPTVSTNKCADDYEQADYEKFEQEITKYRDKPIPTFQIYKLNRLNNDLKYFLKIAIHSAFNPQEGIGTLGFDFFQRLFWFTYSNFPDKSLQDFFRELWCAVLENLKQDKSVTRSVEFSANAIPLGLLVSNQINWLKSKIGCD